MQTNNKFFDDMSKVMTSAMGVAQGAKEEAETTMKSWICLLYTSPSPRDRSLSRMPSSA